LGESPEWLISVKDANEFYIFMEEVEELFHHPDRAVTCMVDNLA
jgi:hypothetical protein